MADIIIHKKGDISDYDALRYVKYVVCGGRISKTKSGDCYCFVTKFADGFYVYADKKKNDIFTVFKREDKP